MSLPHIAPLKIDPLKIAYRAINELIPYARNARSHPKTQVKQIARSIERFGFTNPILINHDNGVIAGHGRLAAAKLLNLSEVPTICLSHLNETERRALILADNKLAQNATWESELLSQELEALIDIGFDMTLTGFSSAEIDLSLIDAHDKRTEGDEPQIEDMIPPLETTALCQSGDVWLLGHHRLFCGDARDAASYDALMQGECADLIFTDPPYNVPIDGHVCGSGRIRHREFSFGAGEMSKSEFTDFLTQSIGSMAKVTREGAIAYICMDWRHMGELLEAGEASHLTLKNMCVWNKTNGGMGTFYRSKHELIFVYKKGDSPHINNFGLGDTGRYRTNVWDYHGISSFTKERSEALAMHPTVKPTALVRDAILDCSKRGDIILDGFGGSGTTLIAAELSGRKARIIEYDPLYCDSILRRYYRLTGKDPKREGDGASFGAKEAGVDHSEGVNASESPLTLPNVP
jgi:DNA modification methylase